MNRAIKQLNKVPGIFGGILFNSQKGIIANSLPQSFKKVKILEIGVALSQMYGTGMDKISDIYEITLTYENAEIIVRKVIEDIFLILVCDPAVDFSLLRNPLSSAITTILTRLKDDAQEITVDQLLASGSMSHALNGMKDSLARVLGPFSKIIFLDAMNEWLNESKPSFSTLSRLIDILVREIKEPEKVRHYIELIIPFVEPGKKNKN